MQRCCLRFLARSPLITSISSRTISTIPTTKKYRKFIVGASATLLTSALAYYIYRARKLSQTPLTINDVQFNEHISELRANAEARGEQWIVTKRITNKHACKDVFGQLTLYQFSSCPFCCKIRAYLDYYGVDYDIIEVDPISKNHLFWSNYKKVPILVAEDFELPLNDSNIILNVLEAKRRNSSLNLEKCLSFTFPLQITQYKQGKRKYDYENVYLIVDWTQGMKQSEEDEEANWRQWVDKSLIPSIGLSVYDTLLNSIRTFKYFAECGDWPNTLSSSMRSLFVVYSGALVMYFVSKIRKRQENSPKAEAVFGELCDRLNRTEHAFISSDNCPNLADLSAFGALKSIEGCKAFKVLIEKDDKFKNWFNTMNTLVNSHAGAANDQALAKIKSDGLIDSEPKMLFALMVFSVVKFLELTMVSSSSI